MARKVCSQCNRPEKVCICSFIPSIDNSVEVGIWQHPTEANQVKGSAILAALSLQNCSLWVGESLKELPQLNAWLLDDKPVYLLYPSTEQEKQVQLVSAVTLAQKKTANFKVLVLDGTWRKTFKMMQLNPALKELPRVMISPKGPSLYKIRKQKNAQSLSTIEAIVSLLAEVENDTAKYNPALQAFEEMQQQQMAFRKT